MKHSEKEKISDKNEKKTGRHLCICLHSMRRDNTSPEQMTFNTMMKVFAQTREVSAHFSFVMINTHTHTTKHAYTVYMLSRNETKQTLNQWMKPQVHANKSSMQCSVKSCAF